MNRERASAGLPGARTVPVRSAWAAAGVTERTRISAGAARCGPGRPALRGGGEICPLTAIMIFMLHLPSESRSIPQSDSVYPIVMLKSQWLGDFL